MDNLADLSNRKSVFFVTPPLEGSRHASFGSFRQPDTTAVRRVSGLDPSVAARIMSGRSFTDSPSERGSSFTLELPSPTDFRFEVNLPTPTAEGTRVSVFSERSGSMIRSSLASTQRQSYSSEGSGEEELRRPSDLDSMLTGGALPKPSQTLKRHRSHRRRPKAPSISPDQAVQNKIDSFAAELHSRVYACKAKWKEQEERAAQLQQDETLEEKCSRVCALLCQSTRDAPSVCNQSLWAQNWEFVLRKFGNDKELFERFASIIVPGPKDNRAMSCTESILTEEDEVSRFQSKMLQLANEVTEGSPRKAVPSESRALAAVAGGRATRSAQGDGRLTSTEYAAQLQSDSRPPSSPRQEPARHSPRKWKTKYHAPMKMKSPKQTNRQLIAPSPSTLPALTFLSAFFTPSIRSHGLTPSDTPAPPERFDEPPMLQPPIRRDIPNGKGPISLSLDGEWARSATLSTPMSVMSYNTAPLPMWDRSLISTPRSVLAKESKEDKPSPPQQRVWEGPIYHYATPKPPPARKPPTLPDTTHSPRLIAVTTEELSRVQEAKAILHKFKSKGIAIAEEEVRKSAFAPTEEGVNFYQLVPP